MSSSGSAVQNGWSSVRVRYNGRDVWAQFSAQADGSAGYVPSNARYIGSGQIEPIGGVENYNVTGRENAALARLNGQNDWVRAVEFGQVLSSESWQTQQQTQLSDDKMNKSDVAKLRSALANAIDKKTEQGKKCADFLEKVLKELGRSSGTDIMKLFEKIAGKEGFSTDSNANHSEATGTVDGKAPIIVFGIVLTTKER